MRIFPNHLNSYQALTLISTIILCVLCVAWEWFLEPLRPNGSWMILKILPIAWFLPGLYQGKNYSMQAVSMIILLYFFEGLTRLFESGLNPLLASLEIILSCLIFFAILKHLGPIKKAAVALKIQAEAEPGSNKKDSY